MGLFKAFAKLTWDVATAPIELAKDVISCGFWKAIEQETTGREGEGTFLKTTDRIVRITKDFDKIGDELE